jgi:DNA-binding transcriptional LysR family regulator
MNLNIRQLEAFRRVMITGSMTVSGEFLNISQPAVSKLIKELEDTLEVRLFRREGNRLIPSPEAKRLFHEVDRYYQGVERIERVAQDLKSSRGGSLRIACMTVLGLGLLCEAIKEFTAVSPSVNISLDVRNSLSVFDVTAANQVDIGFVHSMTMDYPGVEIYPLPTVKAWCMLPVRHHSASKKSMTAADLQGESLISLTANNPMRLRLDRTLEAAGVVCERKIETTLAYSACCMVAGGLGVAVVDAFTALQFKDPGVMAVPFDSEVPFEYAMILPAHQAKSQMALEFGAIVKMIIKKLGY